MATSTVRAGFVTVLGTITSLSGRVHGAWPDTVNPPCAIVRRVRSEAHTSLSGRGSQYYEVIVLVALGTLRTAQTALDLYTDLSGDSSIIAKLEASPTLDGSAEGLLVGDWGEDGTIAVNGVEYWGAILPVEVWVTY